MLHVTPMGAQCCKKIKYDKLTQLHLLTEALGGCTREWENNNIIVVICECIIFMHNYYHVKNIIIIKL